jgi:hypothetical protein
MTPSTYARKLAMSLAMFAVIGFGSAVAARADTVTLNLNTGSTLPDQPYGTVTLTLDGSSNQCEYLRCSREPDRQHWV